MTEEPFGFLGGYATSTPGDSATRSRPRSGRWILFAIIFAIIIVSHIGCLSGCGSGGSSGGGAKKLKNPASDANGVVSTVAVTDLGDNRLEIDFTVTVDPSEDLGIQVEYSEDRGQMFQAATLEGLPNASPVPAQPEPTFAANPGGVRHQVIWQVASDIANLQQHDLVVKVTPFDPGTGTDGVSALSDVFGIGQNQAPQVTFVSTPSNSVGGWVSFTYTVSDLNEDYVGIAGQYSLDGGATYSDATLEGGDGVSSLATDPIGVDHTILWNAQGDVPETFNSEVRLRIRASDSEPGDYLETGDFSLRTYAPSVDLLTVNQIPEEMNGNLTFTTRSGLEDWFQLLLPESNFVIWVEFSTDMDGAAVDPGALELLNSQPIGGGAVGGGYDADSDFGSLLSVDLSGGLAILTVGSELSFDGGVHSLTARVQDVLGNVSAPLSYTFRTTPATATLRPFDRTDNWYLNFSRDNFTTTSTTDPNGTVAVSSTGNSNGVSDFEEDLRILGLNSESPPQEAQDAGVNDSVLEWVKETIAGHLNIFFGHESDGGLTEDSANIRFLLTAPQGSHSRIAVGGDDPIPGFTIGRAEYDYRNTTTNNNTDVDLGVFLTNLIDFYINSSFTFKSKFDPLIPGRGTSVGFHPDDVTVLSDSFDRLDPLNTSQENQRYDEIEEAVDSLGRVVATILAHEIGHSIGLVANGAPSPGLFGGEFNASFAGPYTTDFHLDSPGNNIMAAAVSFSGAVTTGSGAPSFNDINFAYLLERILLD